MDHGHGRSVLLLLTLFPAWQSRQKLADTFRGHSRCNRGFLSNCTEVLRIESMAIVVVSGQGAIGTEVTRPYQSAYHLANFCIDNASTSYITRIYQAKRETKSCNGRRTYDRQREKVMKLGTFEAHVTRPLGTSTTTVVQLKKREEAAAHQAAGQRSN